MKSIYATSLKKGDIYTKKIKLKGREAFLVEEVPKNKSYIIISSRNDHASKQHKLLLTQNLRVYFLRNINE